MVAKQHRLAYVFEICGALILKIICYEVTGVCLFYSGFEPIRIKDWKYPFCKYGFEYKEGNWFHQYLSQAIVYYSFIYLFYQVTVSEGLEETTES